MYRTGTRWSSGQRLSVCVCVCRPQTASLEAPTWSHSLRPSVLSWSVLLTWFLTLTKETHTLTRTHTQELKRAGVTTSLLTAGSSSETCWTSWRRSWRCVFVFPGVFIVGLLFSWRGSDVQSGAQVLTAAFSCRILIS